MAKTAKKYPINTEYTHKEDESFGSFVSKGSLRILQLKKVFTRLIEKKAKKKEPSVMKIPDKLYHEFDIKREIVQGRSVYTVEPTEKVATTTIFYLHGGAFIYNANVGQFSMVTELVRRGPVKVVIPDYPLAPHFHVIDTISMVKEAFSLAQKRATTENIIIMGDTAGGGLALAVCEELEREGMPLPHSITLLNPWVDLTMTNPGLKESSRYEIVQNVEGLALAANYYRGNIPVEDARVSPIYGKMSGLPEINIFTGTHDLLFPDSEALRDRLKSEGHPYRYFEFPKMMHGFMGTPYLRESQFVINQVISLL